MFDKLKSIRARQSLSQMPVVECDVPCGSAVDQRILAAAYFQDSYRAPLSAARPSVVGIFFGIFGHYPLWMKIVLIVRNRIARLCGLDAPTTSEIAYPEIKSRYAVGDKIGVWPIFFLSDTELVAGRDNRHLDFRLSVWRATDGDTASVSVSTICTVHNVFGKLYLFFIIPFHKWGIRRLILNAVTAGRL